MEFLETLGIPVLGYRTDTLPLFYEASGGPPVSARDDVETAARRRRRTGNSEPAGFSSRSPRRRASTSAT
jgi:pseudouridine-5'-phosphate glycosidase